MIIQTSDLHKAYGGHDALRGLSLTVPDGSAFALIGANGAGKTTTIRVLLNLLAPSAGTATVLGVDSRRLARPELAQIGYVSENQRMPGRLTVSQYLAHLRAFYASWDSELERSILTQLRLPPERKIGDLSHGMRMKMALACALPFRPKLLVLDEPFSGLDPLVRDEFMSGVLEVSDAGEWTVLVSSHDIEEVERLADHVGVIENGQLRLSEPAETLQARFRRVEVTGAADSLTALPDQIVWERAGALTRFVETKYA